MQVCINSSELGKLIDRVAMAKETGFCTAHFEAKLFTLNASGMIPNQRNTGVYITDGVSVFTGDVFYYPTGGLDVVTTSFTDLDIKV